MARAAPRSCVLAVVPAPGYDGGEKSSGATASFVASFVRYTPHSLNGGVMRPTVLALLIFSLACAKKEAAPAADSIPAAAPAPAPPPAFSLADAAGTWTYLAKTPTGDTTLVTAELTATADTTGWMLTFQGRKPMPVKVSVSGDSVMTWSGPYESVLRKGVKVTTEGVMHMVDGKMVGTTTAHYNVKTADSVRHLITEATKK